MEAVELISADSLSTGSFRKIVHHQIKCSHNVRDGQLFATAGNNRLVNNDVSNEPTDFEPCKLELRCQHQLESIRLERRQQHEGTHGYFR